MASCKDCENGETTLGNNKKSKYKHEIKCFLIIKCNDPEEKILYTIKPENNVNMSSITRVITEIVCIIFLGGYQCDRNFGPKVIAKVYILCVFLSLPINIWPLNYLPFSRYTEIFNLVNIFTEINDYLIKLFLITVFTKSKIYYVHCRLLYRLCPP